MRKKKLAMPILAVLGIILSSCSTDEKTSTYPPFFSDFYYQPTVSSPSPLPLSLPDSDAYLETARTVVASLIGIEPEIASFPEGEINAMGPLAWHLLVFPCRDRSEGRWLLSPSRREREPSPRRVFRRGPRLPLRHERGRGTDSKPLWKAPPTL